MIVLKTKSIDDAIDLKKECNNLGHTVLSFSIIVNTSSNTLRDWCVSRPDLMKQLFKGIQAENILNSIEDLRNKK